MNYDKPINIGYCGTGPIAEMHLNTVHHMSNTKSIKIFGNNTLRSNKLAKRYGIKVASSFKQIINCSSIDLIDISTSNERHFPYAIAALNASKSVIVEKPAAFSFDEVNLLVNEAKKNNLAILIGFQKRYNESFKRVKSLLETMKFGRYIIGKTRVFMPRNSNYYNSKYRSKIRYAGGGVLIYQAIHDLDLICDLLGPVKKICGKLNNSFHNAEVEDTVNMNLQFVNGGSHEFIASTDARLSPKIENHLFFENGHIKFNDYSFKYKQNNRVSKSYRYQRFSLTSLLPFQKEKKLTKGKWLDILNEMILFIEECQKPKIADLKNAKEVHRIIQYFYSNYRS